MVDSRDINLLRRDVAANCRKLIELAAREGFKVLVTDTVRDDEYQAYLYAQGRTRPGSIITNSPVPTFHSVKAGLAFDICQNVRGREYNDNEFWRTVGALGKKIGFTWGGEWKGIVDKPHFQWDGGGRYTGSMILSGKLPPPMPAYEEDEEVTYEQWKAFMERYEAEKAAAGPSAWSAEARMWAEKNGIITGDGVNMQYKAACTREQMVVFLHRLYKLIAGK